MNDKIPLTMIGNGNIIVDVRREAGDSRLFFKFANGEETFWDMRRQNRNADSIVRGLVIKFPTMQDGAILPPTTVNLDIPIKVSALDGNKVSSVRVTYDGQLYTEKGYKLPAVDDLTFSIQGITQGSHVLVVEAVDEYLGIVHSNTLRWFVEE